MALASAEPNKNVSVIGGDPKLKEGGGLSGSGWGSSHEHETLTLQIGDLLVPRAPVCGERTRAVLLQGFA